jgi:hypothetical protein
MRSIHKSLSLLAIMIIVCEASAMAEDPKNPAVQAAADAKTIAEAERDTAKAKLDKAKADSELAGIEAKSKSQNAQAVAEAEKAVFDKEKAAADAKAAAIAADQAATKASFGSISANSVTSGEVTAGSKAGLTEATILASRALESIVKQIATKIASVADPIAVIPGNQLARTFDYEIYSLNKSSVDGLFKQSNAEYIDVNKECEIFFSPERSDGGPEAGPGALITGVGAALDAASKIASFFQSTYTFANVEVQGIDNALFATALAGAIAETPQVKRDGKTSTRTVYLPTLAGSEQSAAITMNELKSLSEARIAVANKTIRIESCVARLTTAAAKEKNAARKTKIESAIASANKYVAGSKAATKAYDDFITSLAAEESGKSKLVSIINGRALSEILKTTNLLKLFVDIKMQGGGSYTRRNLWNFLGAQPFFVTGGVVASYALVDKDGKVVSSGQFGGHSGYKSVGRIN